MQTWRWVGRAVSQWARSSNDVALGNARSGSLECSRRAVERAEVAHFLDDHVHEPAARASYAVAE